MKKSNRFSSLAIIALVVLLAVLPLLLVKDSEFGGADGKAKEVIEELAPQYRPWIRPLLSPPGPETEGLLFALQAAIGAGIIGYAIGYFRGRNTKKEQTQE